MDWPKRRTKQNYIIASRAAALGCRVRHEVRIIVTQTITPLHPQMLQMSVKNAHQAEHFAHAIQTTVFLPNLGASEFRRKTRSERYKQNRATITWISLWCAVHTPNAVCSCWNLRGSSPFVEYQHQRLPPAPFHSRNNVKTMSCENIYPHPITWYPRQHTLTALIRIGSETDCLNKWKLYGLVWEEMLESIDYPGMGILEELVNAQN